VNANERATSAAASKLRFSVLPNAKLASEPGIFPSLTSLEIAGPLPGGKHLTRPLKVTISYDDSEFVVSEPEFHIHAVGATRVEALKEFRRILSEELDDLTADEEDLGPRLQRELQYLRDLIRTA
jgi:predicted RNase H-like HicB family nuclease